MEQWKTIGTVETTVETVGKYQHRDGASCPNEYECVPSIEEGAVSGPQS